MPWSPSSPSVWGSRIFLTTFIDGELETRCHDRPDGRLRWSRRIKPENVEEHHRSDGSPAAATPAIDGRHVVSYFGSFGLICHDLDGKELWRHLLPLAESGGKFGSGTSPIIVGNRAGYGDHAALIFYANSDGSRGYAVRGDKPFGQLSGTICIESV